jgi:hypothetical protein
MKILKDDVTHVRSVCARVEWDDLKALIVRAVCDELGKNPKDFTRMVEIKQEEQGSPSYRVDRWVAIVNLIENLADK